MLHRTRIPIVAALAVLAVSACSAQNNTRPPPEEPVATTTITRAALTTTPRTSSHAVTTREAQETTRLFEPTTPLALKYRAALAKNPALEGVSVEHIQIEQSDGHVLLRGWMFTVADKVEVEIAVRQMKGVTSVTNDIQVIH